MSKNTVVPEVTITEQPLPVPDNAAAATNLVTPGRPASLLEVQEPGPASTEDAITYPAGAKLYLTIVSVMTASIVYGLDLTIIAVAVPSVTDEFKSIQDIGWYTAVYGLVGSAMAFL